MADELDLLYDDNAFGAESFDSLPEVTGAGNLEQQPSEQIEGKVATAIEQVISPTIEDSAAAVRLDLSHHADLYGDQQRRQSIGAGASLPANAAIYSVNGQLTSALYLTDLDWWVSDAQLKQTLAGNKDNDDSCNPQLIVFNEHRVNGRSRGLAYLLFPDYQTAARAKEVLEKAKLINSAGLAAKCFFVNQSQITLQPFKNFPLLDSAGQQVSNSGQAHQQQQQQQQRSSRPSSSMDDRRDSGANGRSSTITGKRPPPSTDYDDRSKRRG